MWGNCLSSALLNLSNVLDDFKIPLFIHGSQITDLLRMVTFYSGPNVILLHYLMFSEIH